MPYTRPQLSLLIALAAVFLVGLAVREWRAGFPEVAERVERFDREEPATPLPPVPLRDPRPPKRPRPPDPAGADGAAGTRSGAPADAGPKPAGVEDPRPLDVNRASLEQFARLPGIGPRLARRIVEERERRGRFESPDALRSVLGVGPKKLAAVRDLLTAAE